MLKFVSGGEGAAPPGGVWPVPALQPRRGRLQEGGPRPRQPQAGCRVLWIALPDLFAYLWSGFHGIVVGISENDVRSSGTIMMSGSPRRPNRQSS